MKITEDMVLQQICEYLNAKRYFFWRQNNIPVFDVSSKTFRRMPKWSRKGISDLVMIRDGKTFYIEVKAPKGYQTPDQKLFQKDVEKNGAFYILARDIKDLRKHGL